MGGGPTGPLAFSRERFTMIKDFRKAWIIYQYYKKGVEEMEKVKQFIEDHKKEIIFVSAIILSYRVGYKTGFGASERAINNVFKQASKVMEVSKL